MDSTRPLSAIAVLSLLLAAGCAQITLREAMGQVQRRYVRLAEEIERGANLDAREAALDLGRALQNPAIGKRSPQADDPEFQRLLRDAMESVEEVRKRARSFDPAQLIATRGEVSARCQACHDKFRPNR